MRKLLVACGLAVLIAGCGGGADVSGKVKYQGKPVVFGTVVLVGSDGLPKSGAIQPDGSFQVAGVSLGAAKVAVSSPPPPGMPAPKTPKGGREAEDRGRGEDAGTPASPEVLKGWFPLPAKYADPMGSQLTTDVKRGSPLDIDLK